MRTAFTQEQLADPHLRESEHALRTCIHCGFCTATCPTYVLLGDERDSPRGRITLIQNMLEGGTAPTRETVFHLDRCLSCLGCKSACPSGVDYSALIDTARLHIARNYKRPLPERWLRSFVLFVLMRPALFGLASGMARVFSPILPGTLGAMAKKAERKRPKIRYAGSVAAPEGSRRVALLKGCVQSALAPEIDAAATRVLARREIATVPLAGCCGALAYHMGNEAVAKREAMRAIETFEQSNTEAFCVTATGCVSFLKDYGRVFAGDTQWEPRARAFAARVKDFTEIAHPSQTMSDAVGNLTIAYHPPCSLQHGQKILGLGEALLKAAGFRVAEIPDSHMCCGSAGSYSLLQPKIADALRERKLAAVRSTGADAIASANIGCLAHLSGELPAAHIAELVDWAEGGARPF
jgi:glycolate dehydrogenase iron-sulfur subunit